LIKYLTVSAYTAFVFTIVALGNTFEKIGFKGVVPFLGPPKIILF